MTNAFPANAPDIRAAAGGGVTPAPANDDELEGCGIEVEVETSDEELPAAEGGVAS